MALRMQHPWEIWESTCNPFCVLERKRGPVENGCWPPGRAGRWHSLAPQGRLGLENCRRCRGLPRVGCTNAVCWRASEKPIASQKNWWNEGIRSLLMYSVHCFMFNKVFFFLGLNFQILKKKGLWSHTPDKSQKDQTQPMGEGDC